MRWLRSVLSRSTLQARHVNLRVGRSAPPATALFVLLAVAATARAEMLVGVTANGFVLRFDSASPDAYTYSAISGLGSDELILGCDRRPQSMGAGSTAPGPDNNQLYLLTRHLSGVGRLYTLNEFTGIATLRAALAPDPTDTSAPFPYTALPQDDFGIDFNPVLDRLRITSTSGQNFRVNVDTGLVQLDVPLAYRAGDPNFGSAPFIAGIAYSNNVPGAVSTTLRGIHVDGNSFTQGHAVTVIDPNAGLLATAELLPFNSDRSFSGHDISGVTGVEYVANRNSVTTSGIYTLGPGGATLLGSTPHAIILSDIAAPVPEPGAVGLLASATLFAGVRRRKRRVGRHAAV